MVPVTLLHYNIYFLILILSQIREAMKKTTQAEAEVVPSSRLVEVEVGVPRTLVEVIPSVFQWEKKVN